MFTLDGLVIPENTRFEEGRIVASGDVIVCPGSSVGYGITARKVILGEKVRVEGDIVGEEVRIDSWCNIRGNVVSRGDAYIADFASIEGKLTVFGDLDIGRNVKIKGGFEARGLITIQDPLPVIIFVFFYLLELLRLGKLEEAEKLFEELEDEEIINPLVIPENTVIDLSTIKTNSRIRVEKSRVLGNVRATSAEIIDSELFGSVKCRIKEKEEAEEGEGIVIIKNSKVHGAVEGKLVAVMKGSEVVGHIKAERVYVDESCVVEGTIVGEAGIIIKPELNLQEILNGSGKVTGSPVELDGLNRPEVDKRIAEKAMLEMLEAGAGAGAGSGEAGRNRRIERKDPFRFERPDKIPSAREELENTVRLLKELSQTNSEDDVSEVRD